MDDNNEQQRGKMSAIVILAWTMAVAVCVTLPVVVIYE
jgi:hypothetical protein